MTQEVIAKRVAEINEQLEQLITPNYFTLNTKVSNLIHELDLLQAECKHEFKDGICIYCGKENE